MSYSKNNFTAIILAAGSSSRMGTPKQLLRWGENNLISHAIETVLKLKLREVIVILGANYTLIEKEIKQYPITILNNKDWKKGIGNSIAFAAKHITSSKIKYDGVLITLADQPLIDHDFLSTLFQNFEKDKKLIVATSYDHNRNGVPALFDASYLDILSNFKEDYGAKHLLNEKTSSLIKTSIPTLKTIDIDTPKMYEKLFQENFGN